MKVVKRLQGEVNRRLREINHDYTIKNLRRLPGGNYWFDLEMSFNPKDMEKVNRVFRKLLGKGTAPRRTTVQAKFYLSERIYRKLRERAARKGRSQSDLVEEALQKELSHG